MIPKENRVAKKEVSAILKGGRSLNSPSFLFKYLKSGSGATKISFIAPKSLAKNAVDRNLLRRRGYSALRGLLPGVPLGTRGIFLWRKSKKNLPDIQKEIEEILARLN